jgi:aconitate decarboxylase
MSAPDSSADAMLALCEHVTQTRSENIADSARLAARVFLLDSLGVGIAGSRGPSLDALMDAQVGVEEARVLGQGRMLPAGAAALLNACQIHNSEYDCVHEQAVVHPMAVLLGALLAYMDRETQHGTQRFSGRELIDAIVLGVDVAGHIGVASRAGLSFFRPATVGAFAATAAIGRLARFDTHCLLAAMGITYGQLCGTMQAHTEGSPLLAMQAGFNARNALLSCSLAPRGVSGPRQILQGDYGYYALFEGEHDIDAVLTSLGRCWRIEEVAHKPYPSGRATHGVVQACLALAARHGFDGQQVAGVRAEVPSLTHRLVGRAPRLSMGVNEARLCASFAAARALLGGDLGLPDFEQEARCDEASLELARRVELVADSNPDPNALTPVNVAITLHDGSCHAMRVETVYGNPANPMPRNEQLRKFRENCAYGVQPLPETRCEATISLIDDIDAVADVAELLALVF